MLRLDAIRRLVREDETHLVELTRHFFGRFFDNEFVSRSGESPLGLAHLLILVALPGVFYFFFQNQAYDLISQVAPQLFEPVSMRDEARYVYLSMIVIGLAAVLEWDALFPDQLDYLTLTPLPLKVRFVFAAKIAAVVLFLSLFTAAAGAPGSLLYPIAASSGRNVPFLVLCRWIGAHGLSVSAGSVFIFLVFVSLEGLLLTVLSYRWFERVSAYIQGLLIAAMLMFLLLMPKVTEQLPALVRSNSPLLGMLPPMWFFGFYRVMLGYPEPVYHALATKALEGLAAVLMISIGTYLVSYRRHLGRLLEAADAREPWRAGRLAGGLRRALDRTFLREGQERATFSFVLKTILGSRRHRLLFSAYTGVGMALALESIAALLSRHGAAAAPERAPILLSVPLILLFFALSGMRLIFEVPAEIRANWIFQLTEREMSPELLSGVRKAMMAVGTIPMLTLAVPIYVLRLSFAGAAAVFLLDCGIALVLIEVMLLRFQKIPFTCSYLASKFGSLAIWLVCWLGFPSFAYTLARAESWALRNPTELVIWLAFLIGGLIWLRTYSRRFLRQELRLVFEEEREPAVQTLDLSHRALERVAPRGAGR